MSDYWFCVILLCALVFGGDWFDKRWAGAENERHKKAARAHDEYITKNHVEQDESATLARQAEEIAALKEQLEDAEHKEQLLIFQLNSTQRPGGAPWPKAARTHDVEPEVMPPKGTQKPSALDDPIGELYGE